MKGTKADLGAGGAAVTGALVGRGLGLLALVVATLCCGGGDDRNAAASGSGEPPPPAAAAATEADGPAEAPTPLDQDVAMELAQGFVRDFQEERLTELYEHCTLGFAAEMPLENLRALRTRVSEQLGRETEVLGERVVIQGPFAIYYRIARYDREDGLVELSVALNPNRLIAGFRIRVGETRPDEVNQPS